jgi:hypothetical protein
MADTQFFPTAIITMRDGTQTRLVGRGFRRLPSPLEAVQAIRERRGFQMTIGDVEIVEARLQRDAYAIVATMPQTA